MSAIQSTRILKITKHGHASIDGKQTPSKTYTAWRSMISRCTLKSYRGFHRYGGRGIKVCEQWLGQDGFARFLSDMGEKPAGTSLDRRDNDGHYSPENCRWATSKEQGMNRSTNTLLTFEGETMPLAAWAKRFELQSGTLIKRLKAKWPIEKALKQPLRKWD